jgi:hypothetical protein
MRARHLAVITVLLATGGSLYACSTTPGGPLGLIDRDDAEAPSESGAGSDGSVADTSTPIDGAEDGATVTDAEAGLLDAEADAATDADAGD